MQDILKLLQRGSASALKGALIIVIAAAMVMGWGAYCSYAQASQAPNEIKIGVVVDLTGHEADTGREELNAIKLAAEERGNILGIPIKVVAGDATSGETALSETRRLITVENVLTILGTSTMENAFAVPQVTEKYGVPLLELDSWDKVLTEKGYKHYFRICQTYDVYVETLADRVVDFAAPLLGKKPEELRVAIVYDEWAEPVIDIFKEALKKHGIEPVVAIRAPWNTQNYTTVIEQIKAHGPIDILMPEHILVSAVNFRKQMLALRLNPKMVLALGVGWEKPEFAEQVGVENVEGVFTKSWPIPEINLGPTQEFGKKYEARYHEKSDAYGVVAYSAAIMLFDTIEDVLKEHGTVNPDLLTKALREVDIPLGVLPFWWGVKFDEKGNNLRVGEDIIQQWQGGKRVAVYPPKIASGKVKGY